MYKSELLTDFDEYFAQQEELRPEWRAFIEPELAKTEDDVFNFVTGVLLM